MLQMGFRLTNVPAAPYATTRGSHSSKLRLFWNGQGPRGGLTVPGAFGPQSGPLER